MENQELMYYPIVDTEREKAKNIEKKIQEGLYGNLKITNNEDEANAYLVGGGDGFMLDTIKKYYDFEKPSDDNKLFFGVNCGTLGFLLNNIDDISGLPKYTDEIEIVKAHLMKVDISKTDGETETKYALNDVVVGGNILDYFKFDVQSSQINKRFHGTGVLVSTALGSSAYRLNNGYPILPAESILWGIGGISSLPFGHNIIRPDNIRIKIKGRTSAMVGVDGYAGKVDNIQEIHIQPTEHYASILFLKSESFATKRMLLAEQKLLREDF